jgi:hypothetical protein
MNKNFAYVDANKDKFIDNLAKTIEIKFISAWPEMRPEVIIND